MLPCYGGTLKMLKADQAPYLCQWQHASWYLESGVEACHQGEMACQCVVILACQRAMAMGTAPELGTKKVFCDNSTSPFHSQSTTKTVNYTLVKLQLHPVKSPQVLLPQPHILTMQLALLLTISGLLNADISIRVLILGEQITQCPAFTRFIHLHLAATKRTLG